MNAISFCNKIWENAKLLTCPVIVNAYISCDEDGMVIPCNWGDDLNYFFLREIISRPLVVYDKTALALRLKLHKYMIIGSTIDMLDLSNTSIWGAGIINENSNLSNNKPSAIYAVRGPLTRAKLLECGVDCPEVFGDPALLIPLYYQPSREKKFKYGIISHVHNFSLVSRIKIDGVPAIHRRDTLIISLSDYCNWRDIPDKVCNCEIILSSSLHGLIISEAYQIPNIWIEFGEELIGTHFKFHDFFQSIGRNRVAPFVLPNNLNISGQDINAYLKEWQSAEIDVSPLLMSCPFKLKTKL